MLEVIDVSRRYGGSHPVLALSDVSLSVGAGEVVGVLGRNGAGKTTLIKIVSTLLLPTSGTVHIGGVDVCRDPAAARRRFGVVFGGERGLYGRLTAADNARFFTRLTGRVTGNVEHAVRQALEDAGLGDAADRRVETFSRGMRQRLHLAIALVAVPRLLMLDEPTAGIDPIEAQRLRAMIAELAQRGVTILLTSHNLADVEELADRVVVLQEGRVSHDMPLRAFLRQAQRVATMTITGTGAPPTLSSMGDVAAIHTTVDTDGATWTVRHTLRDWTAEAMRHLADTWPVQDGKATRVLDVRVEPVRLEAVFAELTRAGGGG